MTKTVRAKFVVNAVELTKGSRPAKDAVYEEGYGYKEYEECVCYTVKMAPVYTGNTGENRKFWTATPSGHLEMSVMNEHAGEIFKPGQEYYLDFTLAE